MSEEGTEGAEAPAEAEAEVVEGQPDGTTEPEGQTVDPVQLEKDYKELQTKLNDMGVNRSQTEKMFERFGGVDQAAAAMQYFTTDPRFVGLINEVTTGKPSSEPELDEDQASALKLVDDRVNARAQELINQQVMPHFKAQEEGRLNGLIKEMDAKHEGWREYEKDMQVLATRFPMNKPALKDIESLMMMAVQERGDFDKFAADAYSKRLEAKKAQSTDVPGSSPGGEEPKSKDMVTALRAGMKKHNVSF